MSVLWVRDPKISARGLWLRLEPIAWRRKSDRGGRQFTEIEGDREYSGAEGLLDSPIHEFFWGPFPQEPDRLGHPLL